MNLDVSDPATIVVTDSGLGGLSVFAAMADQDYQELLHCIVSSALERYGPA
ncbi:MAG TPA: hypothetical protein VJ943_08350 [Desulfotignum sp.]|nr:hypothetical protein [Desulfotignum sp.]